VNVRNNEKRLVYFGSQLNEWPQCADQMPDV